MSNISYLKEYICAAAGMIGSAITGIFGGWDAALATLIIFMILDFVSGMMVAGIFHKSRKTESGALESRTGFKGLCRKGMILCFVLVAHRLDLIMGSSYIRDTVVISFICNETISIIENAGLMGIPLPGVISNAIDILTKKTNDSKEGE